MTGKLDYKLAKPTAIYPTIDEDVVWDDNLVPTSAMSIHEAPEDKPIRASAVEAERCGRNKMLAQARAELFWSEPTHLVQLVARMERARKILERVLELDEGVKK